MRRLCLVLAALLWVAPQTLAHAAKPSKVPPASLTSALLRGAVEAAVKPPVPTTWSEAEIAAAEARCKVVLEDTAAVTVPEKPFRSGDCGAPAPRRVISVGKNPAVTFDPPALVTCDMVATLERWVKSDLQPLAKAHLGSPILRIEVMSDYSCRNAYGRVTTKLSEHGRANALDIRGFLTAKGAAAIVLQDWGPTQRDLAAAKAAAEKAAAEAAVAAAAKGAAEVDPGKGPKKAGADDKGETAVSDAPEPAQGVGTGTAKGSRDVGSERLKPTIVDGAPRANGTGKQAKAPPPGAGRAEAGKTPPEVTRLGGPANKAARRGQDAAGRHVKSVALPAPGPDVAKPLGNKAVFLRKAHAAACRLFGTTLGPEANNAHRNHFHVDMAPRSRSNYCE